MTGFDLLLLFWSMHSAIAYKIFPAQKARHLQGCLRNIPVLLKNKTPQKMCKSNGEANRFALGEKAVPFADWGDRIPSGRGSHIRAMSGFCRQHAWRAAAIDFDHARRQACCGCICVGSSLWEKTDGENVDAGMKPER